MAQVNICGYMVDVDNMKASTCGKIGFATKGGKKYFVKSFNSVVEPADNGALGAKAMEIRKAEFEEFRRRKSGINKALREVAGVGGNIIFPIEDVVYEHHWTEFTEYVEGVIPDDQYATVISSLSDEEKLMVLKVAIGSLKTVHGQKIVHGDLKLTNIMLVKNQHGIYVSKIIDFDGAFFENDVPLDSITGTVDYYSPELAIYSFNEDEEFRKKISSMITTKSDIFTMGLIIHEYLTGSKPEPSHLTTSLKKAADKGKFIYPWQIILANDEGEEKPQLVISSKIKDPVYTALISDMLVADPERRPSAAEIMQRLNSRKLPIETETWPEDRIIINEMKAGEQVIGLRKIEIPVKDAAPRHMYEIVQKDGRRFNRSREELISMGIAEIEAVFEEPWIEDGITWNMEALKARYSSVFRDSEPGLYKMYDRRGNLRRIPVNQLIIIRCAVPLGRAAYTVPVVPEAKPAEAVRTFNPTEEGSLEFWPEDSGRYALNAEYLKARGIEFKGRSVAGGVNGYLFQRAGNTMFVDAGKGKMIRYFIGL